MALGIEIEDRPFAKSTLQLFRAQLILHEKVREVFESSLRLARQSGYLKKRGMRVALDTTYILGRGAVQDTYNLLADGIVKLLRVLAAVANIAVGEWAEGQGYERYFGSSIKGEAVIDWSDRKARAALLAELVADADRLLEQSRQAWVELPEDSGQRQSIVDGADLLGQLLLQDVRRVGDGDGDDDGGVSLRDGVSKDRMLSVHDPELRHGHKSSHRRFNGHKAAIVVDTDSQLITAVDVLPGNAPDNLGALELVEQSEVSTGSVVEETMGDAAYGDGGTRQTFADAGRRLVAKAPGRPDRKHFPKNDFHLDLAAGSCAGPAGQVTHAIVPAGKRTDRAGRVYRLQAFQFDGAVCRVCPLRSRCIAAKGRQGRRVLIHPRVTGHPRLPHAIQYGFGSIHPEVVPSFGRPSRGPCLLPSRERLSVRARAAVRIKPRRPADHNTRGNMVRARDSYSHRNMGLSKLPSGRVHLTETINPRDINREVSLW